MDFLVEESGRESGMKNHPNERFPTEDLQVFFATNNVGNISMPSRAFQPQSRAITPRQSGLF